MLGSISFVAGADVRHEDATLIGDDLLVVALEGAVTRRLAVHTGELDWLQAFGNFWLPGMGGQQEEEKITGA